MSKLSRRSLLGSAAVVGIAGLSPLEVLAAMPGEIPAGTSMEALSDHAKVRGLAARLVAIDDEITAAEKADDAKRVDRLEAEHGRVYREFRGLQNEIENTPPRCWLDVITRAEFASRLGRHARDDRHRVMRVQPGQSRPCAGRTLARSEGRSHLGAS
jgi:hypothetical protein